MRSSLLLAAIFFAAAANGFTQQPQPTATPDKDKPATTQTDKDDASTDSRSSQTNQNWYVRPTAEKRFKGYANRVVGPLALVRYTATAGLTTWRNTPKEWGDKWEGFGRRFASNLGKSAIANTAIYGLDEALKVDSNFYRSRNRSVSARLRNAMFSTFTARKPNGKRTIGIPRITGAVVSNVIASSTWYPDRYDYVHGLKGSAISLGVNVGFNLVREFVWKK